MTLKKLTSLAIVLLFAVTAAVACSNQSDGSQPDDPTPTSVTSSLPGGVKGTVADTDGGPVSGMRLAIVSGTAPFPEIGPETDAEGQFEIGGVVPGTFQVAVHDRDGEQVGLESVVIQSGETATLDFSIAVRPTIEAEPPLPARPVMRLRHGNNMYDGAEGSYCWPDHVADDGSVVGICADKIAWAGLEGAIPLEVGSTVTIVIESEEPAQELFVGFYEIDSNTQVNSMNLGPGSEVSFSADLAEGVYNVSVFGGWPDGDISYEFRIEVLPEP